MFDNKKLSKLLKLKKITSQQLSEKLELRGIEITRDGVDGYRKGAIKNPKYETLEEIADICGVSLIEFFSNADEQKQQIALDEVNSNPDKYSQSVLSKLPTDIRDLMNYYQMLDKEDREKYLQKIKQKAMSKLHGN